MHITSDNNVLIRASSKTEQHEHHLRTTNFNSKLTSHDCVVISTLVTAGGLPMRFSNKSHTRHWFIKS